jgi:hypothetical protein
LYPAIHINTTIAIAIAIAIAMSKFGVLVMGPAGAGKVGILLYAFILLHLLTYPDNLLFSPHNPSA